MSQDQKQREVQTLKQAKNASGDNQQYNVVAATATPSGPFRGLEIESQIGRLAVHLKGMSQLPPAQLGSHADIAATGSNMVLLDPLDSVMTYADVAPFSGAYLPLKNIPIARCVTAWKDPRNRVTPLIPSPTAPHIGPSYIQALFFSPTGTHKVTLHEPQLSPSLPSYLSTTLMPSPTPPNEPTEGWPTNPALSTKK
eukprot:jgi/Psemu1/28635/gm1.28635_g